MAGSETPQPGWWRASDGRWYPPESLPAGWFIDLDGVAKQGAPPTTPPAPSSIAHTPPREPLPTRAPTYTQPNAGQPSLPSRAWHRYMHWPLWAKIAAPIIAFTMIAGIAGAVTGGDESDTDKTETLPHESSSIAGSVAAATSTTVKTTTTSTTRPASTTTTSTTTTTTTTTTRPPATPIVLSGAGKQIVNWPLAAGEVRLVDYEHNGQSNFIVRVLDASNDDIDLLVNAFRDRNGRVITERVTGAVRLDVQAQGPWKLTFRDTSEARRFGPGINVGEIDGSGNDVLLYFGSKPAIATATFNGQSNFIVQAHGTSSSLVFNEFQSSSAQSAVKTGNTIWVVTAEGAWRFSIS